MAAAGKVNIRKGGRPRLPGAREPSGRHLRRLSEHQHDLRLANGYWDGFVGAMQDVTLDQPYTQKPNSHPLLHLVRVKKIKARQFIIALYWAATRLSLAPRWQCRTYLSKVTGFDCYSPEGCRAARSVAAKHLGKETIKILDEAVFRGEVTDLESLTNHLEALWETWCGQHRKEE